VDVMTVERALKQLRVPNQLILATNGEQALEYLKNENNELPCVILMDLNMPKMNGTEFLRTFRADDSLKNIPVIAMSTSDATEDREQTAKLGVAKYVVKSVSYDKFVKELSLAIAGTPALSEAEGVTP